MFGNTVTRSVLLTPNQVASVAEIHRPTSLESSDRLPCHPDHQPRELECSVQLSALHRAAENKLMATPAVIGTGIVSSKSAAKVGGGGSGYLLAHAKLNSCGVKSAHGLTQFGQQLRLSSQLITVRVIPVRGAEKNLSIHAQPASGRD